MKEQFMNVCQHAFDALATDDVTEDFSQVVSNFVSSQRKKSINSVASIKGDYFTSFGNYFVMNFSTFNRIEVQIQSLDENVDGKSVPVLIVSIFVGGHRKGDYRFNETDFTVHNLVKCISCNAYLGRVK